MKDAENDNEFNKEELKIGKIIYWNGIFGFIEEENGGTIFFHKNSLRSKNIHLLDGVSYKVSTSKVAKHFGQRVAEEVTVIYPKKYFEEYDRLVGLIDVWNAKNGIIKTPRLDKSILFYNTRRYYLNESFKKGDLVVFCPVKSSKHKDELFALFAYKLENETDISFLIKEYQNSKIEGIKIYIKQLLKSQDIALGDKFKIEMNLFDFVENAESFSKLKSKLSEYKNLNYTPDYDLLKGICDNKYLIQLFESNIIDEYDVELMKSYFHKTIADNKRLLIRKFSIKDQTSILEYHIEQLRLEGFLISLNDNVKTLLDIVYRDKETRLPELYSKIKEEILMDFEYNDVVQLWLNGYIEVSENYIINNFDFNNEQLIIAILSKKDLKFDETISKIFEEYFLKFKKTDFRTEYPTLIKRLLIFKNKNEARAKEIISIISTYINDNEKFTLTVFGIEIEKFDLELYVTNHLNDINDYLKIKYLLNLNDIKTNYTKHKPVIESITETGLISFIESNPWNEILKPSKIDKSTTLNNYFLSDIEDFSNLQDYYKPDISKLANKIFDTMPKYNVEHLRLWLNNYVNDEKYDYVGFRTLFKELTLKEKKLFKDKGNIFIKSEVINEYALVVKPCAHIIEETSTYKLYSARLFNLFFEEDKIRIKREDGSYSKSFHDELASYSFNNIPENDPLNKNEIIVKVLSNNYIEEIIGLEKIYELIHTKQIQKALGKVVNQNNFSINENISYVEDWNLVKKIIEFLYNSQEPGYEVVYVAEPKNFFRRLDENSGIDSFEQTALYVIESSSDYAIIWENIDFTDDRATYVFKSRQENIKSQLNKLVNAITTMSQLRSTLIRDFFEEELEIFRNNLGFIGKINKKRGDKTSFEIWQNKLNDLMDKPTPFIPSLELQEMLKEWQPETPTHSPFIGYKAKSEPKKVKIIPDNEIRIVDIAMKENDSEDVTYDNQRDIDIERKNKIYNILKNFNKDISEILIIK